jgi:hypothetical protein
MSGVGSGRDKPDTGRVLASPTPYLEGLFRMTFNVFARRFKPKPSCRGPATRRRPFRPGVEALEERQLLSTWVVTTAADNGDNVNPTPGSLRQAILQADAGPGGDQIVFAIPTLPGQSDVHTIQPPTALPVVSMPLTIDGYTQPGAAVNTAAAFDNASLKIVLDGSLLSNTPGLLIDAGFTTVRGLVIDNSPSWGVLLTNVGYDTVAGNFIGTDVSGKVAAGNVGGGVSAANAGFNTIGTVALGDRNVISGNGNGNGIYLFSGGNSVQNNYVGADAQAVADLPNSYGIGVYGSHNLIGGWSPGAGNFIGGNLSNGCWMGSPSSAFNEVDGNQITFNQGNGVGIYQGAHDNIIGNSAPGAPGNDISFNNGDGVYFGSGTANFVTGSNSISTNGGPGILLLNNANNNQTAPVLASAVVAGSQTTVTGTLLSTHNTTFELNFWDNPPSDPAEGKVFLGSISVTTDPGGNAHFTAQFNTALAAGDTVTATAAAGSGTSQFSAPVTVTLPPATPQPPGRLVPGLIQDVTPLLSVQHGQLRHRGGRYQQTITLHNAGAPLQGPLYLVVDQVTRTVRLRQPAGRTLHAAPLGSPYVFVSLANNMLGPGATRTVVLTFGNPLGRKIRYNLRVLDGPGLP